MEDVSALNNCEVFNQIRTEFSSYHQHKKKLNSFQYFSGYREEIEYLANIVIDILQEHDLIQQVPHPGDPEIMLIKPAAGVDLNKLRGTWMYLVLNSQIVDGDMQSRLGPHNPHCVHLLNQFPAAMSQLLSVSLALLCGLEQPLMELLACGPYWLSNQYFDTFNEVLGHIIPDRRQTLPMICSALSAVIKSISYKTSPDNNLMDQAQRLLQGYLLDNSQLIKQLGSSSARNRYLGDAISRLLDVLLETLEALKQRPQLPDYSLVYTLHSPTQSKIKVESTDSVIMLRLFAIRLLDCVQRLLELVSVHTYMDWLQMCSGMPLLHMQAHIGNQCLRLSKLLGEDGKLKTHSLCPMLGNFANGAQSFEQSLATLTMGELLRFLDGDTSAFSDQQLLAALNSLMLRPISFGNEECVEIMAKHVSLLKPHHAERILDHLKDVVEMKEKEDPDEMETDDEEEDSSYSALLHQVLQPIFQACDTAEKKLQLLCKRDEQNLLNHYAFELEEYSSRRISFFNQLKHEVELFPLNGFLDLCYEQPDQTWLALAQLAMTHTRFAKIYWHVAAKCVPHSVHHVPFTVAQLMQDERLLSKSQDVNDDFLARLYHQPMILQGFLYQQKGTLSLNMDVSKPPYTVEELQEAQSAYLSSWAEGLIKFAESKNFAPLEQLMFILLHMEKIEQRIQSKGNESLKKERRLLSDMQKSSAPQHELEKQRARKKLAQEYVAMHDKLSTWRITNWQVISSLIRASDLLRHGVDTFDTRQIQQLDLILDYFFKNIARAVFLAPELKSEVVDLVKTTKHAHFWAGDHLEIMLEHTKKQPSVLDYAEYLSAAGTLEATSILASAITLKKDRAVMEVLAQEVDQIGSQNSEDFYLFVFSCYMDAFRSNLIRSTEPEEYPFLIEHLLKTPKLRDQRILSASMDNFKILLRSTEPVYSSIIINALDRQLEEKGH